MLSRGCAGSILRVLDGPPWSTVEPSSFSYSIILCPLEDLRQDTYHICGESPSYLEKVGKAEALCLKPFSQDIGYCHRCRYYHRMMGLPRSATCAHCWLFPSRLEAALCRRHTSLIAVFPKHTALGTEQMTIHIYTKKITCIILLIDLYV